MLLNAFHIDAQCWTLPITHGYTMYSHNQLCIGTWSTEFVKKQVLVCMSAFPKSCADAGCRGIQASHQVMQHRGAPVSVVSGSSGASAWPEAVKMQSSHSRALALTYCCTSATTPPAQPQLCPQRHHCRSQANHIFYKANPPPPLSPSVYDSPPFL